MSNVIPIISRIISSPLTDQRPTVAAVARTIYTTLGWRGFYAGWTPIILRAFPANAAAYSVYEGTMQLLGAEKVRVVNCRKFSHWLQCLILTSF